MDYWMIILSIIFGALWIYLFATRNFDYFKNLGIPHLKPSPIFGNMAGMILMTKAMPDMIQEIYDLHPDAKYFGFYEFSSPGILVKDPELVKSIAIKNFDYFPDHHFFTDIINEPLFERNLVALKGEAWRDMRTLLSPAFTSSKMKMMFGIVSKCAKDFADHLAELDPRPEALEMKTTFGKYTVNVIASVAFGLSLDSMKDPDNVFCEMGKEVVEFSNWSMFKFVVMKSCPWLAELLKLTLINPKTSDYFTNVIRSTIATRDANGISRPDMIQLMMQARDKQEKSSFTPEDMAAQAFVFFIGGFDSPSTTLGFAAQALALNPDLQRKLQAEIDTVIEKGSDQVSYEDLHAMKYLDAVVSEVLRIFPPNPILDRIGPKSFTLPPALPGLEPLEVKPGQSVWIPLYSIHHDPRYFPDPEKFDPERFNEGNKSKLYPLTYLPFGLGPRSCIASRFALMEVKLVLFYLLSKCNFLTSSKTQSRIKLDPKAAGLVPEGGFWLKIEPRKLESIV